MAVPQKRMIHLVNEGLLSGQENLPLLADYTWAKVSYSFISISGYHQATCPYKPQWEKYRQKTFSRNVPCSKRTKGKRAFTSAVLNS